MDRKMTALMIVFTVITAGFCLNTAWQIGRAHEEGKTGMKPKDTSHLNEMQTYVTQHGGTEKPFENEFWDHHEVGIYVDIVSGEPLFSSTDKFDSGTGWPSFTKPIQSTAIDTKTDKKLWIPRTEVRSATADSHLGHVFDDGPKEKGGMRYCINSAALRFIPKADMEKEGYSQFLPLFDEQTQERK